ncbi:hypothetical protein RHSIM_Rhsim05G0102900 [Rhododendron simsii]|uniref:DUF4283 domain-containing protein n=1 Tax=Rhododendron simsii TaxID=118357 RepID=A0A834LLT6_RHOSS|nr:hypothetical protein RHSIM_Rhsim05G0102900 [Rhododendron simsii]
MASLDTDVMMVPADEGPSDTPPSFSASSASLSSKKAKRFEIKKWNTALSAKLTKLVPQARNVLLFGLPDKLRILLTALMEGLLPPCSVPEDPRVFVCSDRNVAFELLDGDLRKTYSHLQFNCSDDSVARQIKTLTAENLVLRQKAEDSFSRVLLDGNSSLLTSVPVGKPPSPTTWKDIVAPFNPLISCMNLLVNNDLDGNRRESVASAGVDRWKDWVVGYFVDRKLHFTAVETIAHKIWDQFGLLDVLSNEDDFFFFHFDKSGRYRWVIESGPWHFGGKLMVLKQWHPQMSLLRSNFYNVPLDLWTEGLSHVASAIGKPLYADHLAESCKRISYAKICVEVDTSAPLPESFGLSLPSGAKFTIRVWYPWKPLMCESCHVFDHRNCHPKPVNSKSVIPKQQVWVAKTTGGTAPPFTHAASVSSSIVDDSAGVSAVVAAVLSPAGVSDKVILFWKILQRSQAFLDPDGVLISLPTDEEFNEGLIVENSEIPSPKKKGRGRGKGAKKPDKGDIPAGSAPGKGRLSVHNYSVGQVARIFLGWDPTIFGSSILFSSDQLIVSEFLPLDGSASFLLSVVYGRNRAVDRRQLWDDMRTIATLLILMPQSTPKQQKRRQQQQEYKYETRYFEQCLDHFSFSDDLPTFQRWYLINAEHWVGPDRMGPIFLDCGNEGEIVWLAENTGLVWELAPRFWHHGHLP